MFEINFKMFENPETELFIGEYGYINFTIDNDSYGLIIEEEIEDFSVSIYDWFVSFLKSLEILEAENYVLINDIESINIWIEIRRNKEFVFFSKVAGHKVEQGGWIRKEKLSNAKYNFWKDKRVLFLDFKAEILKKSEKYLSKLIELNSFQNNKILELNDLICKLK